MKSVCVFCGSHDGARPEYVRGARRLGRLLADRGMRLVYGGGGIGLMGAIADAVLEGGGEAVGVIPRALKTPEVAHGGLSQLHVVSSMHERKNLMVDLADAFIALPGGLGTMEEFFEVWTWAQLGIHRKPCGLLNLEGFFDPLIAFLDHLVSEGFVSRLYRDLVIVEQEPEALYTRLTAYDPPAVPKWLESSET